jgi:transposase
MSGQIRYREDFKKDAVSQVVDRGYSVRDVAGRLGGNTPSVLGHVKISYSTSATASR